MKLKLESVAPDFSLRDKNNAIHTLSKINSRYVVLYFYPRDNTPGCTTQAVEFNNLKNEFKSLGAEIVGISGGTNKTKEMFCSKNNISLTLLSDTDAYVAKKYDVYGKKTFMGRAFDGFARTTFILDPEKRIIKIFENVNSKGHALEVLNFLKKNK
jgi:peroxiredoxin Q/BCP